MAASIASDAYDNDWTTRFIQEIEQSVRDRYLREAINAGADASARTSVADIIALEPTPTTDLTR